MMLANSRALGAIGHDERIPLAHRLNEDIFYHILLFLDEDTIAECICTCKSWRILRSERLFKHLCHRIYSVQSRKHPSALKLKNFRCWYDMFVHRPRVRYNGFYLLRVAYCKTPERSMFTDLPAGAILEVRTLTLSNENRAEIDLGRQFITATLNSNATVQSDIAWIIGRQRS